MSNWQIPTQQDPEPDFSLLRSFKLGSFHIGSSLTDLLTSAVWNRILIVDLGVADRMPTIVGVQSDKSDAIATAFEKGEFGDPINATTLADSISVDVPRNGYHALKMLQTHDGACVRVSDDEILHAQKRLASTAGHFAEPAGATSFAGFLKMKDAIPHDAKVVVLSTGNGLKDIAAAQRLVKFPERAIKTLDEIE